MLRITYPDMDDNTTAEIPFFNMNEEYKMPKIDDELVVCHLSNGQTAAVAMGAYWNLKNRPITDKYFRKELGKDQDEATIEYDSGKISLCIKGNEILNIEDGKVTINGKLFVTEDITSDANVKAGSGSVTLLTHTHTAPSGETTTGHG